MKELSKLLDAGSELADKVIVNTNIKVATKIVYRTPVDEGILRASWTPDINRDNTSNSGGDIASVARRLKDDDTFTFINAQPYGAKIEYEAHSPQAPAGMVRISIAEVSSIVNAEVGRGR